MCAIILMAGPDAESRVSVCLDLLHHRGPDARDVWAGDDVSLGFARLTINGTDSEGHQPYQNNNLVGAVNGEIYNHQELASNHGLPNSGCDTDVVLPLFESYGERIIDLLDGFYSAVLLRPQEREVYCLRDHIGKKPLFYGRSNGALFISSELKAMSEIDWFQIVPLGASKLNLDTGTLTQIADHHIDDPDAGIQKLLEQAVRKRLPQNSQRFGIFLSGGLDSSLVAAFASRCRDDVIYFTLSDEEGPDRRALKTVVGKLGLKNIRVVPLPSRDQIPKLINSVVHSTESYNPSIVSNGLATYLLAEAAHEAGIKVVLTGEGADELFGGYHTFRKEDPWNEVRQQLIEDMHYTELRRLDMSCMAHSIEARCPFLDRGVRAFSDKLEYHEMYDGPANKVTLRRSFSGVLPAEILKRRKTSLDVGSGIRGEVVRYLRRNGRTEREELRQMWRQWFHYDDTQPYFHSYPVFDSVINRRGAAHK